MSHYKNMVAAIFLKRPNRFIAHCLLDGEEVIAHVKNTGRCAELLIQGATVYLEPSDNPNRKTKFSLISVQKGHRLVNIDSQVPNQMLYEALKSGVIVLPLGGEVTHLKAEQTYKRSRFDFYFETKSEKGFIEVKGVTLEEDGVAMFPDAPTERGLKHLYQLIDAKNEGYLAYVIFVIQMEGVKYFVPNIKMHKEFGQALAQAKDQGVNVLAYDSKVTKDSITINKGIPFYLYINLLILII